MYQNARSLKSVNKDNNELQNLKHYLTTDKPDFFSSVKLGWIIKYMTMNYKSGNMTSSGRIEGKEEVELLFISNQTSTAILGKTWLLTVVCSLK